MFFFQLINIWNPLVMTYVKVMLVFVSQKWRNSCKRAAAAEAVEGVRRLWRWRKQAVACRCAAPPTGAASKRQRRPSAPGTLWCLLSAACTFHNLLNILNLYLYFSCNVLCALMCDLMQPAVFVQLFPRVGVRGWGRRHACAPPSRLA